MLSALYGWYLNQILIFNKVCIYSFGIKYYKYVNACLLLFVT